MPDFRAWRFQSPRRGNPRPDEEARRVRRRRRQTVSIPSPRKPASGQKSVIPSFDDIVFQSPRRGNPRPDPIRERGGDGRHRGFNPLAEETRVRTLRKRVQKNFQEYVSIPSPRKPASGHYRGGPCSCGCQSFNPLAEETRVRTSCRQSRQRSGHRFNPLAEETRVRTLQSFPLRRKRTSFNPLAEETRVRTPGWWIESCSWGRVSIPSPRKPASGRRRTSTTMSNCSSFQSPRRGNPRPDSPPRVL